MSLETGARRQPALSLPALMPRLRPLGMLPVLVLIALGFWLAHGRFASMANLALIGQQASINIVLASGMTFVILAAGIDLSVGSILAATAMVSVWVTTDPALAPLGPLAGMLAGIAFGAVNGLLIAGLRLPPFIVTLGTMTAIRGIARLIGGDRTLVNPELPFAWIANTSFGHVSVLILIAATVVLASWATLRFTVFGMRVYAVGGNEAAARLAGVRVWLVLFAVYCISGLLAGLGGVMSAARLYSANGLQLGQTYELDAIAAVILGGTSFVGGVGSIWGTLIGALIIAVLSNGLVITGVPDIWQFIIKGSVIVAAVVVDRLRGATT